MRITIFIMREWQFKKGDFMLKKMNDEWRKKYDNDPTNDGMRLNNG